MTELLDLLDWPTYEFETTRPLASDQPLQATPQPPYSRPETPKQPWQPHPPGLPRIVAGTLCWLLGVLVACGLALLFLTALALGMRDLIRLALGSP